jgi:hypothetical protein
MAGVEILSIQVMPSARWSLSKKLPITERSVIILIILRIVLGV